MWKNSKGIERSVCGYIENIMNIALVVFRYGPSHGSLLQTYALYKVLTELGHNVSIIDRHRQITIDSTIKHLRRIGKQILKLNIYSDLFYFKDVPPLYMRKLNMFIDKYLRKNTISLTQDSKLSKIGRGKYDAFIVGSDQTWRPTYVYNVFNYFLDFVPKERNVKRIAYAPSFGTNEWEFSKEQEERCKELIRQFDAVSVREDDGVSLCKIHFDIDAKHVLDPTMLLSRDDYLDIINKKVQASHYVGFNFLDFNQTKLDILDRVCNILGKDKLQINSMTENPNAPMREKVAPTIDDWISGIANADFVIADSFHATVFCVIFHRPFITIANERRGLSRFTSLLKMFQLEKRLVTIKENVTEDLIMQPIDWDYIEYKKSELRKESLQFLTDGLK